MTLNLDSKKIDKVPNRRFSFNKEWLEQEYSGLYRRIAFGSLQGHSEQLRIVSDYKKNETTSHKDWLKS